MIQLFEKFITRPLVISDEEQTIKNLIQSSDHKTNEKYPMYVFSYNARNVEDSLVTFYEQKF